MNWKNSKLVWIAPKLTELDKRPMDAKVIWVLSEWYKNDNEDAIVLKSKDRFFLELIGVKTILPKNFSIRDKKEVKNWEPSKELIKSTKETENLWQKDWQVTVERWVNLKKNKHWNKQAVKWENHFCCLCGGGGYKERFRMYPWPETHYWVFFNLTRKRIEITGENLKENIESYW